MRVRLPDINIPPPEARWKRGAIVEVDTQEEADAILERGGSLVEDEPAEAAEQKPPAPPAGKGKGKH